MVGAIYFHPMFSPRITLLSLSLNALFCQAQWVDIPDPLYPEAGQSDIFHFVNDQLGFVAMNGCKVARTQDGGQTWEQVADYDPDQIYGTLWAIDFDATGMYGVALGQSGLVFELIALITHDGGETWEPGPDLTDFGMQAATLEVVAPDVFLIGYIGTWSITTNNGEDWATLPETFLSVQYIDALHAFRSGTAGGVELTYTADGGSTWAPRDIAGFNVVEHYSFADPLRGIYVHRINDTPDAVMTTTDGGLSWTQTLTVPTVEDGIRAVSLAPGGNGIVITSNDGVAVHVYLTTNYGATWTEQTPPVTQTNEAQATSNGVSYLVTVDTHENYWRWSGPVGIGEADATRATLFTYDATQHTMQLTSDARSTLRLLDATGRLVHTEVLAGRGARYVLDVVPGLYVAQVASGGTAQSLRLVAP